MQRPIGGINWSKATCHSLLPIQVSSQTPLTPSRRRANQRSHYPASAAKIRRQGPFSSNPKSRFIFFNLFITALATRLRMGNAHWGFAFEKQVKIRFCRARGIDIPTRPDGRGSCPHRAIRFPRRMFPYGRKESGNFVQTRRLVFLKTLAGAVRENEKSGTRVALRIMIYIAYL